MLRLLYKVPKYCRSLQSSQILYLEKDFQKSKDSDYDVDKQKTKIKFDDVVGMESAKREIMEFVDIIRNPNPYIDLGAKLPKGALLSGPPGTGKTYLIKALSSECEVPFYYFSGTDFKNKIVGVGSLKLSDLFKKAAKVAPSIIFFDEIDSIGRKRAVKRFSDSEQTLNQLLVEMDGIHENSGVMMFGATNRPDILDKALIRPGRFDRIIYVSLPVTKERKELFNYYLKKVKTNKSLNLDELISSLANVTSGMSPADISNVCNEAAILAIRKDLSSISEFCFYSALEKVQSGLEKKTTVLSKFERRIIAYNEAGKALVMWLLPRLETIAKVSIIPHTMSHKTLGGIDAIKKERFLFNLHYLKDKLTYLLAGRACESVMTGSMTTKAEQDLNKVKELSLYMVQEWGMSQKVGHVCFPGLTEAKQRFWKGMIPYSPVTKNLIDAEANRFIKEAYDRAITIITENKQYVEKLVENLLEKEVLVTEDIEKILGPRPNDVD